MAKATSNPFPLLAEPVRHLLDRKGITAPTPAQAEAIPHIFSGANVLLISPTGSGKTEAAVLPAFHRMLQWRNEGHSGNLVLYITPLRALNRDIMERMRWWGEELGLAVEVRHGDTTPAARRRQALKPPDMLITTPETVQAMLLGKRLRTHLANLRMVIVDEVHELAVDKRGSQLAVALERLCRLAGGPIQRVGLSATVGTPEEVAAFLRGSGSPVEIVHAETEKRLEIEVVMPTVIEGDEELAERLQVAPALASAVRTIEENIRRERSVLTFVNTRQQAEVLSSRFAIWDESSGTDVHHSSLSKTARIEAERAFKAGEITNLVCTSSMELGIDVGTVDLAIQYTSPRQATRLVQRVGRAGHKADVVSRGLVLAMDADDCFEAAVVARRTMAGELEPVQVFRTPLDVVANQVVGLTKEERTVDARDALRTITSAAPFHDLSRDDFIELVDLLCDLGILWRDGETIGARRKGSTYFYNNLSMIPDQRSYSVVTVDSQERIGVLDERFVVQNVEPGSVFICKGRPWRIVGMDEEALFVERGGRSVGTIPRWEGELIPVEWEVAQEVGMLRSRLAAANDKDALKLLTSEYSLDKTGAQAVLKAVRDTPFVADQRSIVIERVGSAAVVHACFGSRVNTTLGLLLSSYITLHHGCAVTMRSDPYRILLEFPGTPDTELVERLILNLGTEHLMRDLTRIVEDSALYRWRFLHVARRFGAIKKDADHVRISFKRIVEAYAGTLLARETRNEVFTEKLDIHHTNEVIGMIADGTLSVGHASGCSPLARSIIEHSKRTVVSPERPDAEIMRIFRERLLSTRIYLFCMHCNAWDTSLMVKTVPEDLECGNCGARLLATVGPDGASLLKRYARGEKLGAKDGRRVRSLRLSADLFISYGPRALLVLAGKGIGPRTAARVLGRPHDNENELLRDIMEAERTFFRTKRFWG